MRSEPLMNLQRTRLLDVVPASPHLRTRKLQPAQTRPADALRTENSLETRFDCAHNTIRTVADAALLARGHPPSTSKPGHHQTTLQCLAQTLDVDQAEIRVLDGLRKQRNLSEYDAEPVSQALLHECTEQALRLLALAQARWP